MYLASAGLLPEQAKEPLLRPSASAECGYPKRQSSNCAEHPSPLNLQLGPALAVDVGQHGDDFQSHLLRTVVTPLSLCQPLESARVSQD